jgi:hypothetical protein
LSVDQMHGTETCKKQDCVWSRFLVENQEKRFKKHYKSLAE